MTWKDPLKQKKLNYKNYLRDKDKIYSCNNGAD
jgi:hypothetical protein